MPVDAKKDPDPELIIGCIADLLYVHRSEESNSRGGEFFIRAMLCKGRFGSSL